jgi:hypothetical protein
MIFKIKIMSEGDQVLNCWDDKIAIRRTNGEVDIFQISIEENHLPTLSEDVWRVTYGNNTIEIIDKDNKSNGKSKSRKKSVKSTKNNASSDVNETSSTLKNEDDDADFVMSIRPKKG